MYTSIWWDLGPINVSSLSMCFTEINTQDAPGGAFSSGRHFGRSQFQRHNQAPQPQREVPLQFFWFKLSCIGFCSEGKLSRAYQQPRAKNPQSSFERVNQTATKRNITCENSELEGSPLHNNLWNTVAQSVQ